MKKAYWIGAAVILGFLVLGLSTFSKSMTPYVSFDEAKTSKRTVQVMGALEKGTSRYDIASKTLHFNLVDPKTKDGPPGHLPRREAGQLRGGGLHRRHRPVPGRTPSTPRSSS